MPLMMLPRCCFRCHDTYATCHGAIRYAYAFRCRRRSFSRYASLPDYAYAYLFATPLSLLPLFASRCRYISITPYRDYYAVTFTCLRYAMMPMDADIA